MGRYVNDAAYQHANAEPKRMRVDDTIRIIIFAKMDIEKGTEIV